MSSTMTFSKLAGLFLLSSLASAQLFSGKGQVIPAVWTGPGIGAGIGCLTDTGLWTTNSAQCGTFTGVAAVNKNGTTVATLLSTSAGYCNMIWGGNNNDHDSFACGNPDNNAANLYEVINFPNWTPFLGFGEYFDLGVTGENPPTGDATSSFHIAGDEETGNLYALTWKAL